MKSFQAFQHSCCLRDSLVDFLFLKLQERGKKGELFSEREYFTICIATYPRAPRLPPKNELDYANGAEGRAPDKREDLREALYIAAGAGN